MIEPGLDGLLVIDKPTGFTSREAVNRAQRWFPRRTRIGHTGTLDPLATGVLVLCIGAATRLTEYVQQMSKIYRAGILLGATSDTDDADGQVTPMPNAKPPTDAEVMQAIASFIGTFDQVPPAYSAAKVTGQRAYDLARKGKDVVLAPRPITIYAIDVVSFTYPQLDLVVRCGKGTYIRSLARDLGLKLGCGGFITSLRRTEVGCFKEADALPINVEPLDARRRLLPMSQSVSELPRIVLDKISATRLLQGQHLVSPTISTAMDVAVFDDAERLLAIGDVKDGVLHAKKGLVGIDSI